MNKTKRNLLAVAGVFSTVFGVVGIVPTFSQDNFVLGILSALLIVMGIVLLAIAWGE